MSFPRYSRVSLTILVLVGLTLAAAGCGGDSYSDGARTEASAEPAGDQVGTSDGATAPDFVLPTLDGASVSLGETAGQVRLIDFWATWCVPCREEIPMLNELQATYGDRGFRVLGISDEEAGLIRDFVKENGVEYTNLVGTEEVTEAYGVLGLPAAYLLDREGRVVDSFLGPKPKKVLIEKIETLLEAGPAT